MDKKFVRWIVGAVVVPLIIAVLSIFGVQIKDALFPAPPPEIGDGLTASLEKRLIVLEAKFDTIARFIHVQPVSKDVASERKSISDAEKFNDGITIKNDSQYSGRNLYVGKRAWDWTVYLEADLDILKRISCVKYHLHPTFGDSPKTICHQGKQSKAFSFSTTGWGTFNIGVTVEFKDGSEFTTNHYLTFAK
ncbi:MAG: pYEATS domain-containing protein [Thermodesulfobacteriota bacterium]